MKRFGANSRTRRWTFSVVFLLVALPTFIGFAGPDALSGRWDRLSHLSRRLLGGMFTLRVAAAQEDNGPYAAYREALQVLKTHYYGAPIDTKKMTYAAIRGMLHSLNDPYTSFLDPEEQAQMQQSMQGEFFGIGAILEPYMQDVRVLRPIPDTPAHRAGIKPNDTILSVGTYNSKGVLVKTTSCLGKPINDVVKLIKGPKGTKVAVTVLRKGAPKPMTFVITRDRIEPPIVMSWMEDQENKIGHIVLTDFNEKCDEQLEKALLNLEKQGMRALVFDLRYNPGGLLNVAADVTRRFVPRGPVVLVQEKNGQRQAWPAREPLRRHKPVPMVVLINEYSASASEIVAGAIQDYRLGTLVGQHTFGKGLVQTVFPLSDGSALRLTTQKYFTANGNDINNRYDDEHRPIPNSGGVKPDVEVKQSEEWIDQNFEDKANDTQLQKALEILRARLATAASGSAPR